VFALDAAYNLGDGAILITAPLMASYAGHQAIAWAMFIDMYPNPADQAKFFPIIAPIIGGGGGMSFPAVIGDGISYFVLAWHVDRYALIWTVLTVVAAVGMLIIWFLVPETLANPKPWPGCGEFTKDIIPILRRDGGGSTSESGMAYTRSFALWLKGPAVHSAHEMSGAPFLARRKILRVVVAISVLGTGIATAGTKQLQNNTLLGPLGFLQEDVAVINVWTKICFALGAGISVVALPKLGPYKSCVIGVLMTTTSTFLFTTMGQTGVYVSNGINAIGQSLTKPAFQIYLAAALQPSELAMAQSSLGIYVTIPSVISGPVFTALFWGTLSEITVGYMFAGALGVACLAVVVVHLPQDITGLKPWEGGEEGDQGERREKSSSSSSRQSDGMAAPQGIPVFSTESRPDSVETP